MTKSIDHTYMTTLTSTTLLDDPSYTKELYGRIAQLEKVERDRQLSELNSVTNRVFTQFMKRTSMTGIGPPTHAGDDDK